MVFDLRLPCMAKLDNKEKYIDSDAHRTQKLDKNDANRGHKSTKWCKLWLEITENRGEIKTIGPTLHPCLPSPCGALWTTKRVPQPLKSSFWCNFRRQKTSKNVRFWPLMKPIWSLHKIYPFMKKKEKIKNKKRERRMNHLNSD